MQFVFFLLLFFTPLNKYLVSNVLGRILSASMFAAVKTGLKLPQDYTVGIAPRSPSRLLGDFGLTPYLLHLPMPIWRYMKLQSRTIAITSGTNYFSIGRKNILGKTSFLNPHDINRYHLWYGVYLAPLDNIFEVTAGSQRAIPHFGYNSETQSINMDEIFLLVQYDYYNYLKKRTTKYLRENQIESFWDHFQFENRSISVERVKGREYFWMMQGETDNKSLLNDSKHPLMQIVHGATSGWIPEHDEKNFGDVRYKGRLAIAYRDKEGNVVDPESSEAKVLTVGYVFGLYWANKTKETPDHILNTLADSFADMDFLPVLK